MDLPDISLDLSGIEETVGEQSRKRYHCDICVYSTLDSSNYKKHTKTHKTKKPNTSTPVKPITENKEKSPSHMCDKCGKRFKTRYGLNLHIKNKHDRTFKYQCSMCERGFNQAVAYRYHWSSHTKVTSDRCKHCKKEFLSQGSLKRHMVICKENGEPSTPTYKCEVCQSTFPFQYSLKYHMRGKHQPPRYRCNECGKVYSWRSSLKAHMDCAHKRSS